MQKTHVPGSKQFFRVCRAGARAIRYANRVTFAEFQGDKSAKLASRNAYRRAIGLPEIIQH